MSHNRLAPHWCSHQQNAMIPTEWAFPVRSDRGKTQVLTSTHIRIAHPPPRGFNLPIAVILRGRLSAAATVTGLSAPPCHTIMPIGLELDSPGEPHVQQSFQMFDTGGKGWLTRHEAKCAIVSIVGIRPPRVMIEWRSNKSHIHDAGTSRSSIS